MLQCSKSKDSTCKEKLRSFCEGRVIDCDAYEKPKKVSKRKSVKKK